VLVGIAYTFANFTEEKINMVGRLTSIALFTAVVSAPTVVGAEGWDHFDNSQSLQAHRKYWE
jgi:hypothetical protein